MKDESEDSQSDLDDDLGFTARLTANHESTRMARFRPVSSELDYPSPMSRMIFKSDLDDVSAGRVTNGPTLPDIFSPPRRKGKKDYIPGSSADVVRSWILAIPAQESHSQELSEELFSIAEVRSDSSGRFAIVTDDSGSRWLLPEQQDKVGTGTKSLLSALRPGSQLLVKGRATRWRLDFDTTGSNTVDAAAYWEIFSPG